MEKLPINRITHVVDVRAGFWARVRVLLGLRIRFQVDVYTKQPADVLKIDHQVRNIPPWWWPKSNENKRSDKKG